MICLRVPFRDAPIPILVGSDSGSWLGIGWNRLEPESESVGTDWNRNRNRLEPTGTGIGIGWNWLESESESVGTDLESEEPILLIFIKIGLVFQRFDFQKLIFIQNKHDIRNHRKKLPLKI
jgi:hypothetical protein